MDSVYRFFSFKTVACLDLVTTGLIAAVLGDLAGIIVAASSTRFRLTPLLGVEGFIFSFHLSVLGVSGVRITDLRITAFFLLPGVGAENFSNFSIFSLSSWLLCLTNVDGLTPVFAEFWLLGLSGVFLEFNSDLATRATPRVARGVES